MGVVRLLLRRGEKRDALPRLPPRVIVHFHDIDLPREYPKVYATNPHFRMSWAEAYFRPARSRLSSFVLQQWTGQSPALRQAASRARHPGRERA